MQWKGASLWTYIEAPKTKDFCSHGHIISKAIYSSNEITELQRRTWNREKIKTKPN